MKPVLSWAIFTLIVFLVLQVMSEATKEKLDPYIIGLIGLTLMVAGVVMLVFTNTWSARAMGIMSTALGTSVIYLGSLMVHTYPGAITVLPELRDAGRSLLVVGGPLFAYGIIMWVRQYFFIDENSDLIEKIEREES